MAKSTAKAEALARELKERLEFRGFAVAESKDSEGFPKLTLNTDEASILIEQQDAVSKDIFGKDLLAFTPHKLSFASRDDAMSALKVSKIMAEVGKIGIAVVVKTHPTVLATAEGVDGEKIEFDVRWATKGQ